MDIDGKVALVTGAGAGAGKAIALRLAAEGAAVMIADIDPEAGRGVAHGIEANGGRAAFVRADVRVGDDVERMVAVAEDTFGSLDILVNNAGDTIRPHFPDSSPAHWAAELDLNLRGPMLATQLALEPMRRRGGGAIVNISSVAGLGLRPHESPEYAAAKAGLIRFTATLAPLRERMNIRVNCVIPHWIAPERVREEIAAMSPEEQAKVPVLLQPDEVADAVVELIRGDELAGRVMVMWCEEPRRFLDTDRRE
jgi:NAD(P)-dependent dehydrogenase (short-subunit alcohol dehydrogenase family)